MNKTGILVVDDQESTRRALVDILSISPFIEIRGTARNGNDAIRKVMELSPDVITLDLEMPEMDGFTFLRWLMKNQPHPVLIISSRESNRTVFKAMELGAVDFIVKPSQSDKIHDHSFRKHLISSIKKIAQLSTETLVHRVNLFSETFSSISPTTQFSDTIKMILIGASTGGPPAIHHIIGSLPDDFDKTILIVQHMPKGFTKHFAERLGRATALKVREGQNGEEYGPGEVIVAPGGYHLIPRKTGMSTHLVLEPKIPHDTYIPSIDRSMIAAAEIYGPAVMGVLLTGMGNDGVKGMTAIKERGGVTIAESDKTAVVFGMPREAIRKKVIDHVLPLEDIPNHLVALCSINLP